MMMTKLVLVVTAVLGLAVCDKKPSKSKPTIATAPTVAADGTHVIAVAVRKAGYQPDKITVKPGEHLKLVITRVEDTECGSQIKVGDGKLLDLPMNQPVEVALTAPASGEVRFACGMDMMTGVIVVDASGHI